MYSGEAVGKVTRNAIRIWVLIVLVVFGLWTP